MSPLPAAHRRFQERYPELWKAYDQMGAAVHHAGPLDEKTRELVKLGIAVGNQTEGGVHSHTRKALDAGATVEEIRQVVLLSIPTIGFPNMMAALTSVDDVLEQNT
jgi:4-carboxymuconolactone decarboxylase